MRQIQTRFQTAILFIVCTLLALPLIAGAAGNTITLEGSTTVLPIAQRAAEVFMQKNPGVTVSVRGGGSGVGITSLLDGMCEVADSSRAIKASEISKGLSKGVDPKGTVIAMDGIVPIVHPSNGIAELSRKQLRDIYTGRASNWSEFGGPNAKIVVISRDSSSGTFEAWGELVLEKAKVRPDALLQASNQAIASVVAKTPGAIGYVGLGYVSSAVKGLVVEGVSASKDTVLSGKYSIARPLFMYTNGKPTGPAKKLIGFILSDEGQKLVEEEGFVPLK